MPVAAKCKKQVIVESLAKIVTMNPTTEGGVSYWDAVGCANALWKIVYKFIPREKRKKISKKFFERFYDDNNYISQVYEALMRDTHLR